jgi:hypothetical protein
LARFGRGFARTQKQRHKQALIDSPRYKATFPAQASSGPGASSMLEPEPCGKVSAHAGNDPSRE